MTLTESLISGLIQGITEFLPISSSAHLVLVHNVFGLKENTIFFDICLHAATLAAVVVFFRKDIRKLLDVKKNKTLFYVFTGTIPAVFAALFFEEKISLFFVSPRKTGLMLIVTAFFLFFGQRAMRKERKGSMNFRSSFVIGIAQAFALLPGISRSGSTISTALISGIEKEEAFNFSFLLSIPAVFGAVLYKTAGVLDQGGLQGIISAAYAAGMAAAFITAWAGLVILKKVIQHKKLYVFSIYCVILGTLVFILVR